MSEVTTARVDHSAAIATFAKHKGIDTTSAGKLYRSRLRSSFATIAKNDPKNYGPKGTIKREANDRRPWSSQARTTLALVFPEVPAFAKAPRAKRNTPKPDNAQA